MNNQYFNPYFNNNNSGNLFQQQQPQPQSNFNTFNSMNNSTNSVTAMIVVNGLEGAKNYLMPPSKTFYLKDAYNNIIYKKVSDEMCNITLTAYKLTEVKLEDITNGKLNSSHNEDFVLKNEFNEFSNAISNRLINLEKLIINNNNSNNNGGNNNNEQ